MKFYFFYKSPKNDRNHFFDPHPKIPENVKSIRNLKIWNFAMSRTGRAISIKVFIPPPSYNTLVNTNIKTATIQNFPPKHSTFISLAKRLYQPIRIRVDYFNQSKPSLGYYQNESECGCYVLLRCDVRNN